MRQAMIGPDPDAAPILVTLPVTWDDAAAAALAAIAADVTPPMRRIHLSAAARAWIDPIERAARVDGVDPTLGERLHRLLLLRQAAPSFDVWTGLSADDPGFVLNLPSFVAEPGQFDAAAFARAVQTAMRALRLAVPSARILSVAMADLHGLLAALGLDYDSIAGRDVARALATIMRGQAEATASGAAHATTPGWPEPPADTVVAHLADAARIAYLAASRAGPPDPRVRTAILRAGIPEALLGVETGGIAPAFSALAPAGGLSRATRAWLVSQSISPEEALARLLAGDPLLPPVSAAAHAAMHDALMPVLHQMPPRPMVLGDAAPHAVRRDLPGRRAGYTQRASVGGHRIFLRTGEYDDGGLGEIAVTLQKESPAFRGLMDAFAASVSIGLQHGVPLDAFVEAFIQTSFGPAGAVEGDPAVHRATSLVDYVVRHLAANYLGRRDLPEAEVEDADRPADLAPLLPMDLPSGTSARAGRRGLRVVSG